MPMAQGPSISLLRLIGLAAEFIAHRVTITMEAENATAARHEAFAKDGSPEIGNRDSNEVKIGQRRPPQLATRRRSLKYL